MKVGILTESPVDAAAIRILLDAALGVPTEPPDFLASVQVRSWPGILHVIQPAFLHYYFRTDALGFVVVADSDLGPVHEKEHEEPGKAVNKCHYCQMRLALDRAKSGRRPRPNGLPLHTAIGLPVPEIAAWYLCGVNHGVSEAAWINGLKQTPQRWPYTKSQLKTLAFGRELLPTDQLMQHATVAACRLSQDLTALEKAFPIGFGSFATQIREWTKT